MKSRIKSKKPIKFGITIEVKGFRSNDPAEYEKMIKQNNPDISQEDLNKEVLNLLKRDSYYNLLMDEVASAYEFELDEDEVKERIDVLVNSGEISAEDARSHAVMPIYKKLIYDDLIKDWEIEILDDAVKEALEQFYKSTGNPIREFLMDKDKFEGVRSTLMEQIVTDRLMNAFNVVYRLSDE